MGKDARALVLVVDDDSMIRAMTRDVLELSGYRVLTAEDGSSALRLLRSHGWEIQVAILDYFMPGLDGERVFQEIRRISPDLPVLFCTGRIEPEVEKRLIGQKARVLLKPIRPSALVRAVETALQDSVLLGRAGFKASPERVRL